MTTLLDADQVLIHSFDDTAQAIKVIGSFQPSTGTTPISGEVSLVPGTVVGVTGTTTVAGTVAVSNFPATQAVSGSMSVIGKVSITEGDSVFANYNIDSASIDAVTGSYTEIDGFTVQDMTQIAVYDTTGSNLEIATGDVDSETSVIYLGPGDSGTYPLQVASGSRLSIRSLDSTAPATGANIIIRLIG